MANNVETPQGEQGPNFIKMAYDRAPKDKSGLVDWDRDVLPVAAQLEAQHNARQARVEPLRRETTDSNAATETQTTD